MPSLSSTSSTRARSSDNVVLDRILNQFCRRLDPELFHHSVLVKGDGARRQVEDSGNFLHRLSFRKKLQDLSLPRCQLVRWISSIGMLERLDQPAGDERRD